MTFAALALLAVAVIVGRRRPGTLVAALLAAALAGLFAATRGGVRWGEAWDALAASVPLPIVSLLLVAMVLAELGRAAGLHGALARILRSRTGAVWTALAPLLLDLADPAAADRAVTPAAGAQGPALRRIAAACAVAGGTFGGTIWLGVLIASEAVLVAPIELLLLIRLLVWSLCGVLVITALVRRRDADPDLAAAADADADADADTRAPEATWTGWAALVLLFGTATVATLNPFRAMPVEAWALSGALAIWLLRPLERLMAWTFKRDAVLPEPPSLRTMTAIVPGAALLCAGLLAGGALAAALPAMPSPVLSTLLATGVLWPAAFARDAREARAVAAAVALPLAHCSGAYGPAGAVVLGVLLAASPLFGPLLCLLRARHGTREPAPLT